MSLCRYQRGLTLFETLVTLVIVAMVAGLMSEGLHQLGRIELRLGAAQLQAQLGRLHVFWVQQALEGLLPTEPGSPEQFQGRVRSLQGLSAQLPLAASAGPMPMRLSLAYRADLAVTELAMETSAVGTAAKPVVLARWPGDEGRFEYLDEKGAWLPDWPPLAPETPPLPRAIAIRQNQKALLVLAVPQASAEPLGKRVDLSSLP